MNELDKVLDSHLKNVEQRFKRIPKSNKHKGMLSEIQNKLDSTIIFTDKAQKIVNQELDAMLKQVNSNLIDKYSQKEVDKFTQKARLRFKEVMQNGLRDSFK